MLYRPEDFDRLTDEPWDAERVRAAIQEIVADTDDALRGPKLLWRADPWDKWRATSPLKSLYVGAAGVFWALDELRQRGHAESRLDLGRLALRALELNRAKPDYPDGIELPEPPESSLLCGETGLLLTLYRVAPSPAVAQDLHARVRANIANEADELMWGSPGTIVAASRMLEWTGDAQWLEVWRESADVLLARRDPDGCWTQRLYGMTERFLGPAHGFVGNVLALGERLDARRRTALRRRAGAVLARTAVVERGLANWPPVDRPALASANGEIRVQWCHGAPGIVTSAAEYLDEELLLAGAELTWQAGPHGDEKGASICHGTAGNGYAFLKAFERTGDERWLERARSFAVHAVEQARRQRNERGSGRYSLFTGDLGVALYAADCLDAKGTYPILDS
jgi:lantibiotic modifying enzyme